MTDRDIRVNSLARFTKESPNLTLQEVPVGCAGMVLRWVRKGEEEAHATLTLVANGPRRAWIDGRPVERSGVWLRAGAHALGIELSAPSADEGLILARLWRGAGSAAMSQPDGTWRATVIAPERDAWTTVDHDDGDWNALVEQALPALPEDDARSVPWLERTGARPLGLPDRGEGPVWIRVEFEVTVPIGTRRLR